MWWGLREQGGHAVAEAVWIWVPKGAGPLEKPREVRLAGLKKFWGSRPWNTVNSTRMIACCVAAGRLGSTSHGHGKEFQARHTMLRMSVSSVGKYCNKIAAVVQACSDGTACVGLPDASRL